MADSPRVAIIGSGFGGVCTAILLKTDWSRKWAPQPKIIGYLEHCARKHGLLPRRGDLGLYWQEPRRPERGRTG